MHSLRDRNSVIVLLLMRIKHPSIHGAHILSVISTEELTIFTNLR